MGFNPESQIVLWLLTQIQSNHDDSTSYKLDLDDFARLTQVKPNKTYDELLEITERLMQRVMEIEEPEEDSLLQMAWLSSAHYCWREACVLLQCTPELRPYLLRLKSHLIKSEGVDIFYSIKQLTSQDGF